MNLVSIEIWRLRELAGSTVAQWFVAGIVIAAIHPAHAELAQNKSKIVQVEETPNEGDNHYVVEAIAEALIKAKLGGRNMEVQFSDGCAVLRGTVSTEKQRVRAEEVTKEFAEVKTVKNELKLSATVVSENTATETAVKAEPDDAEVTADQIRAKLKQNADVRVSKQSLRVALPELAKKHGFPLRFDEDAILAAEIDLDKLRSASMAGATLEEGLKFVLDTAGLKHVVEKDALVITAGKVRPAEPAEEAAADVAVQVVNLQVQEQQILRQIRPLLRVEISFIRAICRPDADGQRKINEDGERLLKAAAKAYTQMMRGGMFPGQTQADPRRVIRDGLAKSVGKHLSAEQLRLYREEISLRDADRRTAAIDSCLAILDEKLVLTVEQRNKLGASLAADWKDEWCPSLETFLYGNEYFPNIPARILTPVLTKPQEKVWNAMPKNTGMVFGGFGFGFMGLGDDGGEEVEAIEVHAEPVALPDDVPQIDVPQIQDEAPP